MDFGTSKDGFSYEQEQMMQGNTFPTSSSSSSSISHHQKALQEAQIYHHNHHHHQSGGGGWYENDNELEDEGALALGRPGTGGGGGGEIEREHMFDKVVTPSDVGKLNRLVIPKQHAEKYFPLDSFTNEKGLLLNFEDRTGKPWRFRYSYWNSSQSYVMTKGWSRFVKEKKLDAGDIVSFQRGIGEMGKDRLFIDWRRRPNAPPPPDISHYNNLHQHFPFGRTLPWSPLFMKPYPHHPAGTTSSTVLQQQQQHHQPMFRDHRSNTQQQPQQPTMNFHYPHTNNNNNNNANYYPYNSTARGSVLYLGSPQEIGMVQVQEGGNIVEPMVFESVPVVHGKAAAKRLRLFGVNMDCPISSEDCDILSTTTIPSGATVIPSQPSSSSIPQTRFFNGNPTPNKGKASLSLDLDI